MQEVETKDESKTMLNLVQIYRSLAVLSVLIFHGGLVTKGRYGLSPLNDYWQTGFSGVHFFFVISGFIILTAHHQDLGRKDRLLPYLTKRLVRIYPFYWIVFMVWGGWRLFSGQLPPIDFLSNAFLFHSKVKHVIPVTWTLAHEMVFYLAFAIMILAPRTGWPLILLWMAGSAVLDDKPSAVIINPINLEFGLGLLSAYLCLKLRTKKEEFRNMLGVGLLLAGMVGFAFTNHLVLTDESVFARWSIHPVTVWGYGISSACLLMGSLSPWVERLSKKQRFLLLVGDASYAIYLVHLQFEKSMADLLKHMPMLWDVNHLNIISANIILILVSLTALSLGILIHKWIEKPLIFSYLRPLTTRILG